MNVGPLREGEYFLTILVERANGGDSGEDNSNNDAEAGPVMAVV